MFSYFSSIHSEIDALTLLCIVYYDFLNSVFFYLI
jgi:hypothetical protein